MVEDVFAGKVGRFAGAAPASLGSLLGGLLQRVATTDRTGLTIGLLVSVALAVDVVLLGAVPNVQLLHTGRPSPIPSE